MRTTDFLKKYVEDNLDGKWLGRLDVAIWRSLESKLLAQAAARIGVKESSQILDIGCGDGYFTNNIFDREKISGVDILDADLKTAAQYPVFVKLVLGDIRERTPFEGGTFDFAFSNCVFEHIPNPDAGLAEISRTLKPGGWLFLSVPSECFAKNTMKARLLRGVSPAGSTRATDSLNRRYEHHNLLPPSVWSAKLRAQGFETILMLKYLSHADYLVWDFFRYYVPNKALRILAALFGSVFAARFALGAMRRVHSHYDLRNLGEVPDGETHNGLVILCQKRL